MRLRLGALALCCRWRRFRRCRRRRWSRPKRSGKRAASRKPTTCSARWWPQHPDNPDYRCAGAGCTWITLNRPMPSDLFNEALELKKDHAGALLGLALVAADEFRRRGRRTGAQGAGGRSQAAGSAGTAGAAGARRQRQRQGRGRGATRPSPSTPSPSRAEPSWPPSTGWPTRRTRPGTRTTPAATRPPATSSSSTAATKKASSITARPSRSIRNLYSARSQLGINLMRLGQERRGLQRTGDLLQQRLPGQRHAQLAEADG